MNPMLRQAAYLHWKVARWLVSALVLLAFTLPQLALRMGTVTTREAAADMSPMQALAAVQLWAPVFPFLAVAAGVACGLTAWAWDHRVGHVYALSLPLTRRAYAAYKLAAGFLLLLLPVLALLLGALVGIAATPLPEGLQAYPVAFTLRFLLAALIVYGIAFALAAGTIRTTMILLVGAILLLAAGSVVVSFAQQAFGLEALWTPLDLLHLALVRWPGPFRVFGGSWMLIDV